MVLSTITLAATVPLLATSTMQLSEQTQGKHAGAESELKTEKCHLMARATKRMSSKRQDEFRDMQVVLEGGHLYLEPKATTRKHRFTGYFLPFPEQSYDGIVSTINDENMLNWIFINKHNYQLEYGIRADAQRQWTGPMQLVGQASLELRVAFEGWEGFVAVKDANDEWVLCFDKNDNGLADKIRGRPVVEVELVRTPLGDSKEDSKEESKEEGDPD